MQNGLPFFHNCACEHPALAGKPLESVDPQGQLLSTFHPDSRCNVAGCVSNIAVSKTSPAAIRCTSKPGGTRFMLAGVGRVQDARIEQLVALMKEASLDVWRVRSTALRNICLYARPTLARVLGLRMHAQGAASAADASSHTLYHLDILRGCHRPSKRV